MRHSRGFTLIEMLVIVMVIVILVAIVLAVGTQVQAGAQMSMTKSELLGLQGALQWYVNKTGGQYPTDMLSFLEGYQRFHAYKDTYENWYQRKNFLTSLPASAVVTWQFPAPGGTPAGGPYMNGVIEVLDAWGYPIQYVPPLSIYANYFTGTPLYGGANTDLLYPYPQYFGTSSTGTGAWGSLYNPPSAPMYTYNLPVSSNVPYFPPFARLPGYGTWAAPGYNEAPPIPIPPSLSSLTSKGLSLPTYGPTVVPNLHMPCFYSYGPRAQNNQIRLKNANYYIYSYNQ